LLPSQGGSAHGDEKYGNYRCQFIHYDSDAVFIERGTVAFVTPLDQGAGCNPPGLIAFATSILFVGFFVARAFC